MSGSTDNDGFSIENGVISKTSNHAGGILGGMSDGSSIVVRAAVKPTPSIARTQQTINKSGENIDINIKGRHDPIIVPPCSGCGGINGCRYSCRYAFYGNDF